MMTSANALSAEKIFKWEESLLCLKIGNALIVRGGVE